MSRILSRSVTRVVAGTAAAAVVLAPAAAWASGPTAPRENQFSAGQSIQIRTDANGAPNSGLTNFRWSVTQLSAEGQGTEFTAQVPEGGLLLRSLQDFSKPPQENGVATFDIPLVDGFGTARSVSLVPPDLELPVALETEFTLNGKPVMAEDILGQDGVVTATYTIKNLTRHKVSVPITSVSGQEIDKEVEADVPMVVEATALLPDRFSGLSTGAGLGGADGRGNIQVKWIALPFSPLSPEGSASFGWSANVRDGFIPAMLIQVLPLYIPPHGEEEGDEEVDEIVDAGSGLGVTPPNVSADVNQIKAGLASVVEGINLLASGGGTDPLESLEDSLNEFFQKFGDNIQEVADKTNPNNPDGITAALQALDKAVAKARAALVEYEGSDVPDAIEELDKYSAEVFIAVNKLLDLLDAMTPFVKDNPEAACRLLIGEDSPVTVEQCERAVLLLVRAAENEDDVTDAIRALNNVFNNIDGAVAVLRPLLEGVGGLLADVNGLLLSLHEQTQIIANGLKETNVDLPALDTVIAGVIDSILSSPGGTKLTDGLDQVSGGLAGVKDELSIWSASMAVALGKAAANAKEALAEAKEGAGVLVDKVDTLNATLGGMVIAAQASPLPYGGDPTKAPAGTHFAGAYEFRMDPADWEQPSTLPRIIVAILLLLIGGFVGNWAANRRAPLGPNGGAMASGAGGAGPTPDGWAPWNESSAARGSTDTTVLPAAGSAGDQQG